MKKSDQIRSVAEVIRKSFEEIDRAGGGSFRNLGGYCGRASAQLWLECMKRGINGVKIAEGSGHAYCIFTEDNGSVRVADVTATQFAGDYPPIFIENFTYAHQKSSVHHGLFNLWDSLEEAIQAGSNLYGARALWQQDREVVERFLSNAGLDEEMLELGIYMPAER
jgi:hypothetical protein